MPKKGVIIPLGAVNNVDDLRLYSPSFFSHAGAIWCAYTAMDGSDYRAALACGREGMRFSKKGVVIPFGTDGDIDDGRIEFINFFSHDGAIWCAYIAYDNNTSYYRAAFACSRDGMRFVKKGVVVPLGEIGDADSSDFLSSHFFSHNGSIWCVYTATDASDSNRIALACSRDGMRFVKKGVVVPLGEIGNIDDISAYYPIFFSHDGAIWCAYRARDGTYYRAALACSRDGMRFIKKGIVIPIGAGGAVDDGRIYSAQFFSHNGSIWCAYTAHDGSVFRAALACSYDGMRFS